MDWTEKQTDELDSLVPTLLVPLLPVVHVFPWTPWKQNSPISANMSATRMIFHFWNMSAIKCTVTPVCWQNDRVKGTVGHAQFCST